RIGYEYVRHPRPLAGVDIRTPSGSHGALPLEIAVHPDRPSRRDAGKPRGIGERLVERLAVLEQGAETVRPILLGRGSALALHLIGEAAEPSCKLHRDRRRE